MADRNFGFNWLSIVAATGIFQKFNDNKGLGFLIAHTQAIKKNQPIKIKKIKNNKNKKNLIFTK